MERGREREYKEKCGRRGRGKERKNDLKDKQEKRDLHR